MQALWRLSIVIAVAGLLILPCGCNEEPDEAQEQPVASNEATEVVAAESTEAEPVVETEESTDPPVEIEAVVEQAVVPVVEVDTAPAVAFELDSPPSALKDVLAIWEADDKDAAADQFVLIPWDDASVFQSYASLSMSEEQFLALPQDQRQAIVDESRSVITSIRALARHMLTSAEGLAESGAKTKAQAYCLSVALCGKRMSEPTQLQITQLMGKSMANQAQIKLTAIQ